MHHSSPGCADEKLDLSVDSLVYDMANKMRNVNLDALNRPRPPTMRYHGRNEVVMEFLNRAAAMLASELKRVQAGGYNFGLTAQNRPPQRRESPWV